MILCLTPNPAIDRTLIVSDLQAGVVARPNKVMAVAGGKSFNVARAVQRLGGQAVCAGLLGGHTGRLIADLAQAEGLSGRWTWLEQETRLCTIIISKKSGDVFELYETGQPIRTADWKRLQSDVLAAMPQSGTICMSGSLPPGCPTEAPADLIKAMQQAGYKIWVDTSGLALQMAIEAKPFGLKINTTEAGEILGQSITDIDAGLKAAVHFWQYGIDTVVLTLGKAGAVIVTKTGRWWARPPSLQTVSAVGNGDTFLAGLVTGFELGLSPADTLCRAVAAGVANTLSAGGAAFSLPDFENILAKTSVKKLAL